MQTGSAIAILGSDIIIIIIIIIMSNRPIFKLKKKLSINFSLTVYFLTWVLYASEMVLKLPS